MRPRPLPARSWPALVLFCAASCRVLPHEERPAPAPELPARFQADASPPGAGEEESLDALDAQGPWWRSFDDASLATLVEEALVHNLDLRAGVARVLAAQAEARIAGADRLPTLGAGVNAGRSRQIYVGLPVPGGDVLESTSTSYGVSLDVSWELDLWGRLAAQAGAAEADLVATLQEHRALRHSIAGQTAKTFFAWQEARQQLRVAQSSEASYASTLELVERRYASGLTSVFEVRLAETDLAVARALVEERSGALERVVRQLQILVGRYPDGTIVDDAELPEPPPTPPAGAPGQLIARRPDLAAAEARLAAADERLYAARAALYPRLSLSGAVGRTSNRTGDLFDPDFSIWSVAAGLTQPLFQGGRLRAGVDLADAGVVGALASFESSLLAALGEVEVALVGERRLERLEAAQAIARDRAEAASELARTRYEAGLTDLLEVLEAQRRALGAESSLLDVRRRRLDQRVDLHLALGGGFGPVRSEKPSS